MKKENKTAKALVVILVVGIGMLHNIHKKSFLYEQISPAAISWTDECKKTDTAEISNAKQESESKLFIYTKKIIDSSIQQLISNL